MSDELVSGILGWIAFGSFVGLCFYGLYLSRRG
jgi:hypothetical protein